MHAAAFEVPQRHGQSLVRRQRLPGGDVVVPALLYVLNREDYERMRTANPLLHQALLAYVVTVMAERLSFASRVIGVLRR